MGDLIGNEDPEEQLDMSIFALARFGEFGKVMENAIGQKRYEMSSNPEET